MARKPIMIRTFHAVGHGCFVTERFKSQKGNDEIKVVYDCGGTNKKVIEREINNAFKINDNIYALCISHFDNDHINGLPTLISRCNKQIGKLWIPRLTIQEKIICILKFCLEYENDFSELSLIADFIYSPRDVLNDTEILEINGEDNTEIGQILDKLDKFKYNFDWIYAAFYHNDKSYDTVFKNLLNDSYWNKYIKLNSDKSTVFSNTINKDNYEFNKDIFLNNLKDEKERKELLKKIRTFFNKYGGTNNNSLILYSGNDKDNQYELFLYIKPICFSYCCSPFCFSNHKLLKTGCLYLGDYNASKYFNASKDEEYLKKYLNKCDTILLPHHGSLESFSDNLLEYGFKFAVACHDIGDRYGHPSSWVCDQLYLNNKTIISVTEETSTSASFIICHER